MSNRDNRGHFQPGQSGNPRGRPKADFRLAEMARKHSKEALNTVLEIMRTSDRLAERLQAAALLLDRGFGKAPQCLDHNIKADQFAPTVRINLHKEPPNPQEIKD